MKDLITHSGRRFHIGAAFTLIELLIVIAIIAILALIAIPNFLEAQMRSKVARCAADMRSIETAIMAYVVDYNNEPRTQFGAGSPYVPVAYDTSSCPGGVVWSAWWGFVDPCVTTPVAYMTDRPVEVFQDKQLTGFWKGLSPQNNESNQPYVVIRDTDFNNLKSNAGVLRFRAGYGSARYPGHLCNPAWIEKGLRSGFILVSPGPDKDISTMYFTSEFYDPTNGTISFADLYRFGSGSANDDDLCN